MAAEKHISKTADDFSIRFYEWKSRSSTLFTLLHTPKIVCTDK